MKRIMVFLLVVLTISGCGEKSKNVVSHDLEIESYYTSIGSLQVEGNNDSRQRFEYTINIVNNDLSNRKIISVEPLLSDNFKDYVVEQKLVVEVNKVIASGEMIEVTGMIIFNADKLTKEDILDIKPFVNNMKIIEEKVIEVEL